mgnify:CR=1 FL=1
MLLLYVKYFLIKGIEIINAVMEIICLYILEMISFVNRLEQFITQLHKWYHSPAAVKKQKKLNCILSRTVEF